MINSKLKKAKTHRVLKSNSIKRKCLTKDISLIEEVNLKEYCKEQKSSIYGQENIDLRFADNFKKRRMKKK